MKALLIGNTSRKYDAIPYAQLYPFFDNQKQLQKQLGLSFKHIQAETSQEIAQAAFQDPTVDVLFIRPDWREDPTDVEQCFQLIRERYSDKKIIAIDPFDQASSRFFNILPYVDRLLKHQRLRDVHQYQQPLAGGTVITDYLVKELGYDIKDWSVQSVVPAGFEHRIGTGWNVTLIKRFKQKLLSPFPWHTNRKQKSIDIFCRLSYGPQNQIEWYTQYRMAAVEALQPLASHYNLAVSGEFEGQKTISSRQYFQELQQSRIAFCPFGWGETTWRDYEAICYDCLLMKPDMSHVDTQPNIFIPFETYVPVRWDLQDVAEKCHYYLQNPEEADRIIQNARHIYTDYFKQNGFVKTIQQALLPASKTRFGRREMSAAGLEAPLTLP